MKSNRFDNFPADIASTLKQAQSLEPEFQRKLRNIPHEEKGVWFSELLFMYAAIGSDYAGLILESGRARGQSTLGLGLLFPNARVVSVEMTRDPADAPIAEARLQGLENVRLEYGDSRAVLPSLLEPDSVVFIDGPKNFRAVRLALSLLRTGKARCVFVHDMFQGQPIRRFLQFKTPGTFFSDENEFVNAFQRLDSSCWEAGQDDASSWKPHYFQGEKQASYGPTLACIPYISNVHYGLLLIFLRVFQWRTNFSRFVEKRIRRSKG